jgi:hypothetical protein
MAKKFEGDGRLASLASRLHFLPLPTDGITLVHLLKRNSDWFVTPNRFK